MSTTLPGPTVSRHRGPAKAPRTVKLPGSVTYLGVDRPFPPLAPELSTDLSSIEQAIRSGAPEIDRTLNENGADLLDKPTATLHRTPAPATLQLPDGPLVEVRPGALVKLNNREYTIIGRTPGQLILRERGTEKVRKLKGKRTVRGELFHLPPVRPAPETRTRAGDSAPVDGRRWASPTH